MPDSPLRAAKARELVAARGFAILATISARKSGFPFGSIANYAADNRGRPVFFLSALAVHAKNLEADSKASLVVFDESAGSDPLASPRLNLMGHVAAIPEEELGTARSLYISRHPESAEYLEFGDFSFYRMEIEDVYYIGGFGEMGWVSVSNYESV